MPIGVTTKKYTIPITIGEIIFPKNSPNFIQSLFKGVKSFEFNNPRIKKIKAIINAQSLGELLLINGQRPTINKKIEKIIPKLLLEPIFFIVFLLHH